MSCRHCSCWECQQEFNPSPKLKEGERYWCTDCAHLITDHYYGCEIPDCKCDDQKSDSIIATEENKMAVIAAYHLANGKK